MVAGNKSLNCENLVGGEGAEDVSYPQCLRIAVEDHICASYSAKGNQGLLFISVTIDIGAEQEPVWRKFRHAHSSEEPDRICWILVLHNRCYVDDVGNFFGVEEAENILPTNCKLRCFGESDDDA